MRLRAKLASLFLILLLVPIFAMSLFSLHYIVSTMVDDLSRSADVLTDQIFEQMRLALAQGSGDPATLLSKSASLRKLIDSSQAFGAAVVAASIIGLDNKIIVAAHGEGEGQTAPQFPPISLLDQKASSWRILSAVPAILTSRVYASQRPVELNDRPFATVSVAVTTALINDEASHLLAIMLTAAALLTLIAWIAASLIANRILTPLAVIGRGFDELKAGSRQVELNVEGEDELSALAEKFNELSRQVRADRTRLETGRSRLFDIVRSIQDAVVLVDANGVALFANKKAHEHLAPAGASIEGESLTAVLGQEHALVPMLQSTMDAGNEAQDVPIELPDGAAFLVSFFRLGHDRKPAGVLIVLRHLDPVIELETALDYSNRLARLGALISGVAHQLRSPLQAMNLRLELIRQDHGDAKDHHIDRLRQEVERLDQAVEALLRFMRPEDLKVANFDANALIRELGARVKNERILINYELSSGTLLANADRGMIAEAAANLIDNAVQSMPNGGGLTLSSSANGPVVELVVRDQGVGIAKEQLDQVFNLYYTTKPEGSGLGLSFALRAIELNGGKLEITSTVGEGTACKIMLPAALEPPAKPAASTAEPT